MRRVLLEHVNPAPENLEAVRLDHVALELQLRYGIEPLSGSWMTRDEHQIPVCGALWVPFQVIRALDRLAVFVDPEQREVEVVARIREVVRIASEESSLVLGSENQPHVRVLLVAVEPVFTALIERDHVGPQAGLLQALAFDVGYRFLSDRELVSGVLRALQRVLDPRGD